MAEKQPKANQAYTTQSLRDAIGKGKLLAAHRGQVYDLTRFAKSHPGGEYRIRLSAGRDVTTVFETSHPPAALQYLQKFHVGYLTDNKSPLFRPPNEFAQTLNLRVREYFQTTGQDPKYSPVMILYYLAPVFGILLGYWLLYWNPAVYSSFVNTSLVLIFWSLAYSAYCLFWVHDSSHASFTHSPKVWGWMSGSEDFVMGVSHVYWFYKHVLGHHPYTNIIGVDPDISVEPFSVTRFLSIQDWQPFYTLQHFYAPILYGALLPFYRYQDFRFYIDERNCEVPLNPLTTTDKLVFWGGKIFFFGSRWVFPILFSPCSAQRVLTTFFVSETLVSCILACCFESNHVVDDISYEKPPQGSGDEYMEPDWAEMQIKSTQDYGHGSWLTTYLTGGLNYQVPHHLFPQVHQTYYPKIAPIILQTCKEYNVAYRLRPGFLDAFGDHLKVLKKYARR